MPKTNFCKLVTDIIYERCDSWWSINNIAAKTLNMKNEDFMNKEKIKVRNRNIICEHIKTFIPHVYKALDEMGELLLSEIIEGERRYKRATKGDEPYVIKKLIRDKKTKNRAKNRFDTRLDNADKKRLLPGDERKKLE